MVLGDALRVLRGESTMPGGVRCYLAQCTLCGGASPCALTAAVRGAWGAGPSWPPPAAAAAVAGRCGAVDFAQANLWACDVVGMALTGTHFDAHANLLVVLRGEKRVLAAPFSARALLSAAPLAAATPNHAEVDLFDRRYVEGGDVSCAMPAPHLPPPAVDATLRAGDALFLPEGLWHSVLSSPGTVAVNFWFSRGGIGGASDPEYEARLALLALARQRVAAGRAQLLARAAGAGAGAATADGEGALATRLAALLGGGAVGAAIKRPREGDGGVPAAAEGALLAAAAGPGGGRFALRTLLALLEGEGGAEALRALLEALSAGALDILQALWEEEEGEEEGGGGGQGEASRERCAQFQRVWAAAWGDAAAGRLAGAREAVMRAALERAAASVLE
jgi:hypothetical protein